MGSMGWYYISKTISLVCVLLGIAVHGKHVVKTSCNPIVKSTK